MSTTTNANQDQLDVRVAALVQRGLLTPEQAAAILTADREASAGSTRAATVPAQAAPPRPAPSAAEAVELEAKRRVPAIVEVLAYVGGVLALRMLIDVLVPLGEDYGWAPVSGILVALSAAALWGGQLLFALQEPSATRIGGALWLAGVASLAAAAGVAVNLGADFNNGQTILTAGVVALVSAASLWWIHRSGFQLVALIGASITTVLGIPLLVDPEPQTATPVAAPIAAVGALWLALGLLQVVTPVLIARLLGAAVMMGGLVAVTADRPLLGAVLASLAALTVLAIGTIWDFRDLIGVGGVGLFIAFPQLGTATLPEEFGYQVGGFAAALVLLAVAFRYARRSPR